MSDQHPKQTQDAENNQQEQVKKNNNWHERLTTAKKVSPEEKQKKINEALLKQLGVKLTITDDAATASPLKMKITQVITEKDHVEEKDDENSQKVYFLIKDSTSQENLLQEAFLKIAQKMKGHFTVPLESIQDFNALFKIGNTEVTVKSFEVNDDTENDDTENDEETTNTPASYEAKASIEINGIEAFLQSNMIKEVSGTYDTQAYEQQAIALTHRTLKAGYDTTKYNQSVLKTNNLQEMTEHQSLHVMQSGIMHDIVNINSKDMALLAENCKTTDVFSNHFLSLIQALKTLDDTVNRNIIWNNGSTLVSDLKNLINQLIKIKTSTEDQGEKNKIQTIWFKVVNTALEILTHEDLGKAAKFIIARPLQKQTGESTPSESHVSKECIKSLLTTLIVASHQELDILDSLPMHLSEAVSADDIMKTTLNGVVARHVTIALANLTAMRIENSEFTKAVNFAHHFRVSSIVSGLMNKISKDMKIISKVNNDVGSIVSTHEDTLTEATPSEPSNTVQKFRERIRQSINKKQLNSIKANQIQTESQAVEDKIAKHDTEFHTNKPSIQPIDSAEGNPKLLQQIKKLDNAALEKDTKIQQLEKTALEKDTKIQQLEKTAGEKDTKIQQLEKTAREKDAQIQKLQQNLGSSSTEAEEYKTKSQPSTQGTFKNTKKITEQKTEGNEIDTVAISPQT